MKIECIHMHELYRNKKIFDSFVKNWKLIYLES